MIVKTPVDLHIHTNASDGYLEPLDLLKMLRSAGIETFAVTDHDSVASLDEMKRRAGIYDMRLITGVELSAEHNGCDLHFLGYHIDHHSKRFLDYLYLFRRRRYQRAQEMVEKLVKMGAPITIEDVVSFARSGPVGRPHIADALIKKGFVENRDEAFDRFLGEGGSVYVEKYRIGADEVIQLVHSIGGAAVLAHPGLHDVSRETILELIGMGLDGIEVIHPHHSQKDVEEYSKIAGDNDLLITGGSDFHGDPAKDETIGQYVVDISVVDQLIDYCDEHRGEWIVSEEDEEDEEIIEDEGEEDDEEEENVNGDDDSEPDGNDIDDDKSVIGDDDDDL